jgi:hypothetical protein
MLFMRCFSFALLVSIFFSGSLFAQAPQGPAPTYTKDVAVFSTKIPAKDVTPPPKTQTATGKH